MARRETADVLRKARGIMSTAQLGLSDLAGPDPARRIPGMHNVIVFGRAVTFVLQNLRTIDSAAFDEWYGPHQEEMKADPLLKYFNKLRTTLEKEGGPDTGAGLFIEELNMADLAPLLSNPPPGAMNFFIGDQSGGSGWEVAFEGDAPVKYYIALPETVRMAWSLHLPDPPTEHLGQPIEDPSAVGLSRLFLAYIARLLDAADVRFGIQESLNR